MSARARAEAAKRVLHHENSKIHEEHEKDLCCLLRVFVSFVLSWLALGDCLQEDDRLTPPWTIIHHPLSMSHQPSAISQQPLQSWRMKHQPRQSFKSPRFAQPATFMRLPHVVDSSGLDVAIVGVPFDGGTSYRPGARLAPREIRAQSSLIRPYSYFQKVAPFERLSVADVGDIDAPPVSIEKCYDAVEAGIGAVADPGARPIVIGGDHSISLPVLRALARRHGPLALVQFDAHIDTWDEYFGGKYFHGTPFRRAIEEGIVDGRRFIQVGIRGPMYGLDDFDFHRDHGITVIDIDQVKDRGVTRTVEDIRRVVTGRAYMTFDIDSVDPAFAPGTGTPEVGGLTSHEAQRLVRGLAGLTLVGGDIVEVSPLYDGPGQITAVLASNLMFEFLCAMVKGMALKK